MTTLATVWLVLPLFVGFCIYLLPRVDRWLALGITVTSLLFGGLLVFQQHTLSLRLLDNFGVSLRLDVQSGFFILTNALVTAAVILYCWHSDRRPYFYTQLSILHGCLNSIFACDDFISVYVALECASIAVFLLIAHGRTERTLWVALRYLFVSNTAMLFYLMGAMLVYQATYSFAFSGLSQAPIDAIAFILVGLLTKGGGLCFGIVATLDPFRVRSASVGHAVRGRHQSGDLSPIAVRRTVRRGQCDHSDLCRGDGPLWGIFRYF